jgi:hypothetical protein
LSNTINFQLCFNAGLQGYRVPRAKFEILPKYYMLCATLANNKDLFSSLDNIGKRYQKRCYSLCTLRPELICWLFPWSFGPPFHHTNCERSWTFIQRWIRIWCMDLIQRAVPNTWEEYTQRSWQSFVSVSLWIGPFLVSRIK